MRKAAPLLNLMMEVQTLMMISEGLATPIVQYTLTVANDVYVHSMNMAMVSLLDTGSEHSDHDVWQRFDEVANSAVACLTLHLSVMMMLARLTVIQTQTQNILHLLLVYYNHAITVFMSLAY